MRIAFLVPNDHASGGMRAVHEHSRHLAARGHQVQILIARLRGHPSQAPSGSLRKLTRFQVFERRAKHRLKELRRLPGYVGQVGVGAVLRSVCRSLRWRRHIASCLRPYRRVRFIPRVDEAHMPDTDALIVYDWTTALAAAALPERCGTRFYLVQADEALLGAPPDLVEQSLRLPYHLITVSTALKRALADRYGLPAAGPVLNGVDREQFHVEGDRTGSRVGMVHWRLGFKASKDGLLAVELARRECPDLRLVLFGRDLPDASLLTSAEFHYDPPQRTLRRIYSSCGIWLSPSRVEGSGMPIQEAMACGCAVIATDCGAVRDFGQHGENMLIVPPGDVNAMAASIVRLVRDEGLRRRIAAAASSDILACSWDKAAAQLEAILRNHGAS